VDETAGEGQVRSPGAADGGYVAVAPGGGDCGGRRRSPLSPTASGHPVALTDAASRQRSPRPISLPAHPIRPIRSRRPSLIRLSCRLRSSRPSRLNQLGTMLLHGAQAMWRRCRAPAGALPRRAPGGRHQFAVILSIPTTPISPHMWRLDKITPQLCYRTGTVCVPLELPFRAD
jgi:hypothetical protein